VPRRSGLRSVPGLSGPRRSPPKRAAFPGWLGPLLGNFERPAIIPRNSEAQRFLESYLGILSHPLTTPGLRYVVLNHIHELIAVALGDADDATAKANRLSVPKERLKAIKADILENLSSPELTETTVALRQRVTSRYIRKLLRAEGTTFSKFVLSQRLMHAHHMLSDPLCAGMKISDIALEAGFSDLSYFDRTFHRRFHGTPSEVRAILVRGHHRVVSEGRSRVVSEGRSLSE
jgi:AraC-like DNA-binding protein